MSIFRPPTDDFVPLALPPKPDDPEEVRLAYNLFRHYGNDPRGRNVFKLTNGTFTENEPNDNTTIARTYFGGSDNIINDQEAAELTAAGYGAYIS
jgi:hypothetical protein